MRGRDGGNSANKNTAVAEWLRIVAKEDKFVLDLLIINVFISIFVRNTNIHALYSHMKDIIVYIPLPPYLREWLTHQLGSPVRFPARSYESLVLTRLCTKRPKEYAAEPACPMGCVPVVLPDNKWHKPEYYNHLSREAQTKMAHVVKNLFRLNLWTECCGLISSSLPLNEGIQEWCRLHGIACENREAVRQTFYRMRQLYEDTGIILGKKRKKTTT